MIGAAAGQIVGQIIGAGASLWQGHQQRKLALYMSNTAMQRRVADLRAANLNPILAMPAGGASSNVPPVADPGKGWDRTGTAIAQIGLIGKQKALLGSQKNKTDEEARAVALENEKREITRKPYLWLNQMIESGKMPEMPDSLKELFLEAIALSGSHSARDSYKRSEDFKNTTDPFKDYKITTNRSKNSKKKKRFGKGEFKKFRSNWNKAPKDPFRHHYTPQDRGKNRRD